MVFKMTFQINVEEYLCVICREILIDPVTLPCFHTCCRNCLEKTLDSNKYQCFLCRKFIGSWYRNAKRRNELINHDLSKKINENFSHLIEKRINGETVDILLPLQPFKISCPGEIKEEFDTFIRKIEGEVMAQQEKENKLSEELIKLLEEEERQLKLEQDKILKSDELIARELASEINADLDDVKEDLRNQLSFDEDLARKLSSGESKQTLVNFGIGSENRSSSKKLTFVKCSPTVKFKSTPQIHKMKRRSSAASKFGPMDRFVGFKLKK